MRRLLALHSSIALVLALLLAPFQHVHLGVDDDDHADYPGHRKSADVHAHGVLLFDGLDHETGPVVTAPADERHAVSLDSFFMTVPAAVILALQSTSAVQVYAPESQFASVERIEVCSHDPPPRDFSPPRAPPL
jgi:hypothetical protein